VAVFSHVATGEIGVKLLPFLESKKEIPVNIFQMRHKVLEGHRGERFTPGQLRVEFQRAFPAVNPTSINAADCFNTPSKRAGCTCKECTRIGGFAVNRDGIVDMGASGWGGISSVYKARGNTRSSFVYQPPLGRCLTP